MAHVIRALRSRNFRLFAAGQFVSLIGTLINLVATSWLVYRLARGAGAANLAFTVGWVAFVGQAPQLLLSPLAGVWVDRGDRHRILLGTQTLSMLQSAALAYVVFRGYATLGVIVGLSLLQGFINAVDMPARQTFVAELVDARADLPNAIALNTTLVHVSRFIGPALAGLLIFRWGEGACFLVDAFSYFAVLASLFCVRPRKVAHAPRWGAWGAQLREGWDYVTGFAALRALLLLMAACSFLAMSQMSLMPLFADGVFHGGERAYGWLSGASGLGALLASLYLVQRRSTAGLEKLIGAAALVLGALLMAFSACRNFPLAFACLAGAGAALLLLMASSNMLVQAWVDDDKRGRVTGLSTMAFLGVAPLGNVAAGALAGVLGAPWTLCLAGAGCVGSGAVFLHRLSALRRPLQSAEDGKEGRVRLASAP